MEDAAEGTPAQRTIRETVKHHFAVSACILQKDVRIGKIIGFYSVVFAAHTLLFFYSQQYFADLGYNKVQISVIMLLVGGASCLGALVSEKMYRWFGKKCLIPETVIIAGAILCYGAGKAGVAIAALMCAGFANAALYPIQSDSLNALIPSEGNLDLGRQHVLFHRHDCAVPAGGSTCRPVGVKDGFTVARRHFTTVSFDSLLHRKRKLFKRSFLMYDEKSEVSIC